MSIKYKCVDGIHVFTSDDVKGLYVASKDKQKALDNLPLIINDLAKLNNQETWEGI